MTLALALLVACGSSETPVAIAPEPEPIAEPVEAPREPEPPEPPNPTAGLECSADRWCRIHASGIDLQAIYAASATEIFAGGADTTLLRWTDGEWTGGSNPELTGRNRTADVGAMHGAGSIVFAVGNEGYAARFDNAWSRIGGSDTDLHGVFAISASDAWAVGNAGTVLHFDGSAFARERSGTRRMLNAVWSAAGEVFAVGLEGAIVHRDASGRWRTQTSGTTESLTSVWGMSARAVFAIGHSVMLGYDGSAWTAQETGAEGMTAIAGSGSALYVVGVGGLVLRKTDDGWTTEASGVTEDLLAVSVAPDGTAFAAGRGGVVLMKPAPRPD